MLRIFLLAVVLAGWGANSMAMAGIVKVKYNSLNSITKYPYNYNVWCNENFEFGYNYYYNENMAQDSVGNVWLTSLTGIQGQMLKINSTGTLLIDVRFPVLDHDSYPFINEIAIDSTDNVWCITTDYIKLIKISSTGVILNTFNFITHGIHHIKIDNNDNVWVAGGTRVAGGTSGVFYKIFQINPSTGTINLEYTTPVDTYNNNHFEVRSITCDGSNNIWVFYKASIGISKLYKYDGGGEHFISDINVRDICSVKLYESGGVIKFYVAGNGLDIFSSTGVRLYHGGYSGSLDVDDNGEVWVVQSTYIFAGIENALVRHYSNTLTLIDSFSFGTKSPGAFCIFIDANGYIWVNAENPIVPVPVAPAKKSDLIKTKGTNQSLFAIKDGNNIVCMIFKQNGYQLAGIIDTTTAVVASIMLVEESSGILLCMVYLAGNTIKRYRSKSNGATWLDVSAEYST